MTLVYATSTDLTTWTGGAPPANVTQLLRSASLIVREATQTAYYAVDGTGLPTDTATVQAFNDATCAQAAFWAAADIDPTTAGVNDKLPVRSKGIGTARIDYDTNVVASVTAYEARRAGATSLCPEAFRILQQAGVLSTAPWMVG